MDAGPHRFPPERRGRLIAVGDGHLLHVEEYGSARGLPVVVLHDGPGIGCRPAYRSLFDTARFRAVLIDQRGAGSSLPPGECEANTTPDLVADIEQVREALGIPAWIVFGHGWGSLLALAYAQLFPERVTGLVLCCVFLGSPGEIGSRMRAWRRWLGAQGTDFSQYFPLTAAGDPLAALAGVLAGDGPLARRAARDWLAHATPSAAGAADDDARLADARLQLHYLRRHCFVAVDGLLAGVTRFRHRPGVLIQGLADPACPPHAAEDLHRVWPEATWIPVPGAAHDLGEPAIARAVMHGLDWVAESAGTDLA